MKPRLHAPRTFLESVKTNLRNTAMELSVRRWFVAICCVALAQTSLVLADDLTENVAQGAALSSLLILGV